MFNNCNCCIPTVLCEWNTAQTTQTKLNQVELMKQFIGIWKNVDNEQPTFGNVNHSATLWNLLSKLKQKGR